MPKRALKFYIDNTKYLNRQSAKTPLQFEDNNDAEQIGNEDDEEEFQNIEPASKVARKTRLMRVRRFNQNNEIERLLLYSGKGLYHHCDHSDFPCFNVGLWPYAEQELLSPYPSCAFSVPRPIHISDQMCPKIDLCYKRPMVREFQRQRLSIAKTIYQRYSASKRLRANEKEGNYHNIVFDFAERVHSQTDPYFHGSYDYYYTGGNLCTLPQSGNVVHASGDSLHKLEMSEFPIVTHYPNTNFLSNVATLKTTENSEIFEIKPFVSSIDTSRQNTFIARQRNVISLNCLNEYKQIKVITQFRTKSTPFISFAQSDRDPSKLLITTMKQHVRLYDLGNSAPKLVKLYEIDAQGLNVPWNMIRPWRENTFLYANNSQFSFIDTRTTPDQWMATAISAIENNFICDHITSIAPSEFNNIFYVATNHKLHCMDIRHIKSDSFDDPEAVICRWTHQLQYAPLMIDTFRIRNYEYIALSSALAGDLHICQLNRQKNVEDLAIKSSVRVPKHIYRSTCLPYQPPTMMEAYECARLAGKCLQPEAKLKNRLLACTTGLAFSRPSDTECDSALALLLTSNSLGDVFVHTLTKREGQEGDSRGDVRSNEMMDEMSKRLMQKQPALSYTHIRNMKAMRKVFLCKFLNADLKYDLDAMDDSYSENETPAAAPHQNPILAQPVKKKRKRLHLGRWQKSFATLHSYKDALVSDLLSIWDIDMDDDKKHVSLGSLQTNLNVKPDPSLKVQDWLNTSINPIPPMISIPTNSAAKYLEPPVATMTNERNDDLIDMDINLTQNSVDFENAIQSTQVMDQTIQFDATAMESDLQNITTKSLDKSKKKTKKYVKGF